VRRNPEAALAQLTEDGHLAAAEPMAVRAVPAQKARPSKRR
jgi:hypothetical protein